MAIADEIAAKESIQVQQQLIQSVNSVSKNSAVSPSSGVESRVSPPLRQDIRPNSSLSPQPNLCTCLSCGNAGHVRSKSKFKNATYRKCNTRGRIARACRKNGVNAVCVEDELTEEPLLGEDEM